MFLCEKYFLLCFELLFSEVRYVFQTSRTDWIPYSKNKYVYQIIRGCPLSASAVMLLCCC